MNRSRAGGVYIVEFALVGSLLFVLLFGALEMGRLLFTVNALNEVVRRGARLAVVCNIQDGYVLRNAVFADSDGGDSKIVGGLSQSNLRLVYRDDGWEVVSEWSSAGSVNKALSDSDFNRIRFAEVVVDGFPFNLMVPGFGAITLDEFRAVLPRESLGQYPDAAGSPKC